jgi:hypothetical protein
MERSPDGMIAVDRNWKRNAYFLCELANIVQVLFEDELRGMHAYDDQPLVPVFLSPRANISELTAPVNAGVSPELDQDNFPAQVGGI